MQFRAFAFACARARAAFSSAQVAWNHDPASNIGEFLGFADFSFATCGSIRSRPSGTAAGVRRSRQEADADRHRHCQHIAHALPAITTQYVATPFFVETQATWWRCGEPGSSIRVGRTSISSAVPSPRSSEHTVDGTLPPRSCTRTSQCAARSGSGWRDGAGCAAWRRGKRRDREDPDASARSGRGRSRSGWPAQSKDVLPQQMGYYTYSGSLTTRLQ